MGKGGKGKQRPQQVCKAWNETEGLELEKLKIGDYLQLPYLLPWLESCPAFKTLVWLTLGRIPETPCIKGMDYVVFIIKNPDYW